MAEGLDNLPERYREGLIAGVTEQVLMTYDIDGFLGLPDETRLTWTLELNLTGAEMDKVLEQAILRAREALGESQ